MIDTVILTIPTSKVVTLDLTEYGVHPWDLQSRNKAYHKFVKNPSSQDKESGKHFPRLTEYHRVTGSSVKIEFSAPKLLYKNNIDEIDESQFDLVLSALQDRLNRMGVKILPQELRNASVMSVHYSRNFELQEGYTSQYVLGELGKIDLSKRFDFTRARYINDGQSLCAYTKAHSVILYDKIADLRRNKKRAIDKEQSPHQLGLFEELKQTREILRYEIRLSEKRKMNSLFKKLGFKEKPTFEEVFSVQKSKAVLSHYWNTIFAKDGLSLFACALSPKDLLKQILVARKSAKGKSAVYHTGLLLLARESNGLRELRSILAKKSNDRAWYRLVADFREIAMDLSKLNPRAWYVQIIKALENYEPFRIKQDNFAM